MLSVLESDNVKGASAFALNEEPCCEEDGQADKGAKHHTDALPSGGEDLADLFGSDSFQQTVNRCAAETLARMLRGTEPSVSEPRDRVPCQSESLNTSKGEAAAEPVTVAPKHSEAEGGRDVAKAEDELSTKSTKDVETEKTDGEIATLKVCRS